MSRARMSAISLKRLKRTSCDEVPKGIVAIDFVECQRDSANSKQVWFALAALAILLIPILAPMG